MMKSFGLRLGMAALLLAFLGCGGGGPPVGLPSSPPPGAPPAPPGPSPLEATKGQPQGGSSIPKPP